MKGQVKEMIEKTAVEINDVYWKGEPEPTPKYYSSSFGNQHRMNRLARFMLASELKARIDEASREYSANPNDEQIEAADRIKELQEQLRELERNK